MMPPTLLELVEAVRERLDHAVDAPVEGFEARVMRNVMAIIERELELGPDVERRRSEILDGFGTTSEEALADLIRQGALDDRAAELRHDLLELAERQLSIDNPRW